MIKPINMVIFSVHYHQNQQNHPGIAPLRKGAEVVVAQVPV